MDHRLWTMDYVPTIKSNWSIVHGLLSMVLLLTLTACGTSGTPPPKSSQHTPPPSSLQKVWEDPEQLFKEARKNYRAGNYSVVATALERILTVYPKSSVVPEAKKMSEEIQTRLGSAGVKIGVLLPLSGSYARFGEAVLDGISCAIGLFDPCGSNNSKTQIVVRDTKGSPSLAAQEVQDLVEKEKVSAIIGPLLSTEAPGSAAKAQALQIPMIVLAPQEGVTNAGDFIFQHTLQPQNEVSALVQEATKEGLKKFILLYPNNPYGKEYQLLFTNELMQTGAGKVIATKSYSADLADFNSLIEELKLKTVARVGIFIPDSYKEVAEIAQALEMAGIQGPKLFGPSRWYHPNLLSQKIANLDGAFMDTSFYPDANREATKFFADAFLKTYGNSPAWLEAFAYDATRLLLNALGPNINHPSTDTRNTLLAIQNFPGVVGSLSWSGQRVSKWPLDIIAVHENRFQTVSHP